MLTDDMDLQLRWTWLYVHETLLVDSVTNVHYFLLFKCHVGCMIACWHMLRSIFLRYKGF